MVLNRAVAIDWRSRSSIVHLKHRDAWRDLADNAPDWFGHRLWIERCADGDVSVR